MGLMMVKPRILARLTPWLLPSPVTPISLVMRASIISQNNFSILHVYSSLMIRIQNSIRYCISKCTVDFESAYSERPKPVHPVPTQVSVTVILKLSDIKSAAVRPKSEKHLKLPKAKLSSQTRTKQSYSTQPTTYARKASSPIQPRKLTKEKNSCATSSDLVPHESSSLRKDSRTPDRLKEDIYCLTGSSWYSDSSYNVDYEDIARYWYLNENTEARKKGIARPKRMGSAKSQKVVTSKERGTRNRNEVKRGGSMGL